MYIYLYIYTHTAQHAVPSNHRPTQSASKR